MSEPVYSPQPQSLSQTDPVLWLINQYGFDEASKRLGIERGVLEEVVIRDRGKKDPEYFDRHCLKIQTKNAGLISLVDNPVQKKIEESIARQRLAGKPVRIKIPKARRHGVSTKVQAAFFRDAMFESNISMMTICHDLESARNLREMFDRFYKHYPLSKPRKTGTSDKWWKFKDTDVSYLIDTADELDTGRSFTLHRLHISEVAFYRNPEVLMTGLLRSVDRNPNTVIVAESTANGFGGWWYEFVKADNGYDLLFFPWYDDAGNSIPFKNEREKEEFADSLTSYESELLAKEISLEQLNWRRTEIKEGFNGDESLFQQEYPATLDESFLVSGRPYFQMGLVREQLLRTETLPCRTGYLEWNKAGESVEFVDDPNGWWKLFSEPQDGWVGRYVTGSDSAEGKMIKETSKTPDNSVCTMFDRVENKDAARFCSRIDTDLFKIEVHKASVYFGSACDCVERNASGLAVIDGLKETGVPLYRRELIGKTEDRETVEYGFQTNAASRDLLLSELRTWVRTGVYRSDDHDFWRECSTFVYDDKGKPQGQPGEHDDRVFSSALAVQACLQAAETTPIEKPQNKKEPPPDADIWDKEDQSVRAEF